MLLVTKGRVSLKQSDTKITVSAKHLEDIGHLAGLANLLGGFISGPRESVGIGNFELHFRDFEQTRKFMRICG